MSFDKTLVVRSQSHILSALTEELIENEAYKCSSRNISVKPVKLEPIYAPPIIWSNSENEVFNKDFYISENRINTRHVKFICWISPDHALDWTRAERFIKTLKGARDKICFNILGNIDSIKFQFIINEIDRDLLKVAFNSSYNDCEITEDRGDFFYGNLVFNDYYPVVSYHNLLTRTFELTFSPFEIFIHALVNLKKSECGFTQIIFEPVRNNWHSNVEILTDLEYVSSTINPSQNNRNFGQQTPSSDMKTMAREVEAKAHNDKPFYFVAVRSGVMSDNPSNDISGLVSFLNLFQSGGQSLGFVSNIKYEKEKTKHEIRRMFIKPSCYRCGFLVNSLELAGLVHIPTINEFSDRDFPINILENRALFNLNDQMKSGIIIGKSNYAGKVNDVYINDIIRRTSTHLIGRSGSGKSTEMEHMILQDINNNSGLAFIDPHGDSIKRLLKLIPREKVASTIYIDFGDQNWIPIWNPLQHNHTKNIGRAADDLVSSVKNIIKGNAWGDRLEHLLRNGFFGLLHLPDSTFYDLVVLFEYSKIPSKEKRELVDRISKLVNNPVAQRFWTKDLASYGKEDFRPPHHKLSKFLNSEESVSLMLTQSESYLDIKKMINSNSILLFDLSSIGPETRKILGSYLFTLLHNYSLSRSSMNINDRNSFNIYCDEAHKLTTDALEDMIIETRKFGVNLTLAHQYLNQFNDSQRDALLSMGTTIIFNVDLRDAKVLVKDLQNKVNINDIASLKTGEAIARIGTQIIKVRTRPPIKIPQKTFESEIIKRSRERYYLPTTEVKNRIQKRIKDFRFSENDNDTSKNKTDENELRYRYEEIK